MTEERRRFSRAQLAAPTEMHQGASSWQVELIDISLNGIAVTQPDNWDADYSQLFSFVIQLPKGSTLEVFAHLVHVESGSLGFELENLEPEQMAPLAELLAEKLGPGSLTEEIKLL